MSSKNKKHTHKYYRAKSKISSKGYLWTCALPNCSHHMPEHYEEMLVNKFTLCWGCGEQTTLDARTMAMDKPLCTECDPNALPLPVQPDIEPVSIGEMIHGKDEIEETKRILAQFAKIVDAGEDYNDE